MGTNAVIHCVATGTPYVQCRAFTPGTGWGSLLTGPSGLPSGSWSPQYPAYHPSYRICVFGGNTGSSIRIFTYRMNSSGFSTQLSDGPSLSVVPTGFLFHPTLPIVVIALGNSSPYIRAYTFNTDGWGAALTNAEPSTLPARETNARAMAWNTDGTVLFVGHVNSPFMRVYNFSSTGFGSVITNSATLPPSHVRCMLWRSDVDKLAAFSAASTASDRSWTFTGGAFSSPYTGLVNISNISRCKKIGGYGLVINSANIQVRDWSSTNIGGDLQTVNYGSGYDYACGDISNESTDIVVGLSASPYIRAYPYASGTIGTVYANPSSLPAAGAKHPIFAELSDPSYIPHFASKIRTLRD